MALIGISSARNRFLLLVISSRPKQIEDVLRLLVPGQCFSSQERDFLMVRKIGLSAVAVALIAGAVATSAAEARRGPNRIAANGTAVNQKPAAPAAKKGAVAARKAPGEGSVRSVIFVQLPAK